MRGAIGALALSQSGFVLMGLCSAQPHGIAGALVQTSALGLAITGLGLVAWGLAERIGPGAAEGVTGVAGTAPRLGALGLVCGLAAVGLPGFLPFVAEELLLHGVLQAYPTIAITIVMASVLNGVSFLRIYTRVFLGPPSGIQPTSDMHLGEQVATTALVVLLIVAGVFPQTILELHERTAVSLGTTHRENSLLP
jgi:NADH-quinone oxidoreductase subunit M